MSTNALPEVWLRGLLPDVPPLFQPVAHGLLQCREELHASTRGLTTEQLLARPAGVASVAYHMMHAAGSLDRLFSYARGEALSRQQLAWLTTEGRMAEEPQECGALVVRFDAMVDRALAQLRATDPSTALDPREVGRAKLPSTVIGLLFHAAEHTQRHIGQLVTTARIVRASVSLG